MNNNQYGIFYFKEKILGYDKMQNPITTGDFVIETLDISSKEEARGLFNSWKDGNKKDNLLTNKSFVEIIIKKGEIGNFVYINKIK